jgi:transcriptional regulator with XRE-family HTH domain
LFAVARGLSGDNEFQESDFLALFRRYESLSEAEKPEIDALLETVSREIEQRSSQIGWQHLEEMITFLRPITLSRRMALGEYVRRVLDEKGLTLTDVQLRSGGRISRSYIHQITGGQIKNLTVEKIRGLAAGLGVAEDEVFRVARDMSSSENLAFQMSALAKLYRRYEGLSQAGKKELRPLVEMLDREIDWRNMLAIRVSADKARKCLAHRAAH